MGNCMGAEDEEPRETNCLEDFSRCRVEVCMYTYIYICMYILYIHTVQRCKTLGFIYLAVAKLYLQEN